MGVRAAFRCPLETRDTQMTATKDADRILLTVSEASKALSISQRTLWALTAPRGPLPAVRIGRRAVRYDPADLREFIDRQKQGGEA